MTVNVPDRFKAANAFWTGLGKIPLTPFEDPMLLLQPTHLRQIGCEGYRTCKCDKPRIVLVTYPRLESGFVTHMGWPFGTCNRGKQEAGIIMSLRSPLVSTESGNLPTPGNMDDLNEGNSL